MTKECCKKVCTARYTFAILTSLCLGLVYAFKMLLSVALLFMQDTVALTKKTPEPIECGWPLMHRHSDGPITSSHFLQGIALAAYYMGFLFAQIPFAYLAERTSAKCVMAVALFGNTICAFLTPACATFLPIGFLCGLRAIQGILSGGAVPAANVMIVKWCPPEERTLMYGVVYSGPGLGVVFGTGLPGFVVAVGGSWDWMFYITGIIAVGVSIVFLLFVSDSPARAYYITEEERKYIQEATSDLIEASEEPYPFPWGGMCKSCPFWAIAIAHFCSNIGWYFIITSVPTFLKWIFRRDSVMVTMMLAAAYLMCFVFSLDMSAIGVVLFERGKVSVTAYRKIANAVCSIIPMALFIAIPYVGCQTTTGCILFVIIIVSVGAMSAGVIPNCIDIAPNFAGMVIVASNTISTIPGIAVPIVIGWELDMHPEIYDYWFTFLLIAAMYLIMFLVYTIFASAEVQIWNFVDEEPSSPPTIRARTDDSS